MANITNEVLAEKIDGINLRLSGMEKKIDAMPSAFISHEVLDLKLGPIEGKLTELERKRTLMAWGVPAITGVLGSVLTYLIIQQLGAK